MDDGREDKGERRGGFYTVNIMTGKVFYPYIVFAHSAFDAAHRVREATGYLADRKDVEGPYDRQ